jgi:hypothetical protein
MADNAENAELENVRAQEIFHKREWRIQRIGWTIVGLFIAAACAGIFGNGPLADQKVIGSGARIELDRFARRHASTRWVITVPRAPRNSLFVRINADFLNRYRITAILPEPAHTSLSGPDVRFAFDAMQAGGNVVFHVEPDHVGISQGVFRLGDSAPMRISQLVYP